MRPIPDALIEAQRFKHIDRAHQRREARAKAETVRKERVRSGPVTRCRIAECRHGTIPARLPEVYAPPGVFEGDFQHTVPRLR